MRTLATVLTICCLFLPLTTASAGELVKKPAVLELELKELPRNPCRQVHKPAVITKLGDLAEGLGYCLKERLPYQLAEQVDFKNEQILFFSWSGSAEDKLAFQIEKCKATTVTIQYLRGRTDNTQRHFRMIVLPKNAFWSVSTQQHTAE